MTVKIDTVAATSVQDPREMSSWSGIPAHICVAFEDASVRIVRGGPLPVSEPPFLAVVSLCSSGADRREHLR
jgi:hypothetical protein